MRPLLEPVSLRHPFHLKLLSSAGITLGPQGSGAPDVPTAKPTAPTLTTAQRPRAPGAPFVDHRSPGPRDHRAHRGTGTGPPGARCPDAPEPRGEPRRPGAPSGGLDDVRRRREW